MEKSGTTKQTKGFREIRSHELGQASSIRDACRSKIGIDSVGKNRVKQWESKHKPWDSQSLVERRETEAYNLNVMTVGNEVVGYLAYFPAKKFIVIDELGVAPIHWRNGFATYMIRRLQRIVAVTEGEPFGFKGVGVRVAEKNLAAQLLFRRCGFKWIKTICHDLPGHDTYAMQCKNQVFGGGPVS